MDLFKSDSSLPNHLSVYQKKKEEINDKKVEKLFSEITESRGGVAKVISEYSSFYEGLKAHMEFYYSVMMDENLPLPRMEREFIGLNVSEFNKCNYCKEHHQEAYQNVIINSLDLSNTKKDFFIKFSKLNNVLN